MQMLLVQIPLCEERKYEHRTASVDILTAIIEQLSFQL